MNGKVLFIICDVYQEDNQLPLGPAYLAAILRNKGYHVETYCMDIYHYTNEDLKSHLESNEYDLIGVGFVAARFNMTIRELSKTVNKYKKNAYFILGGHGPSPIPEYMLKTTRADLVMLGEGENTILELMECILSEDKDFSKVKGIAYRIKDKITVNMPRLPVSDINTIPFPAWDLFPMDKYVGAVKIWGMKEGDKSLNILTSRGCVNRCSFCYRMEKGIRVRTIENIIEEIKILYNKYGVKFFVFDDEMFMLSKRRLLEFKEKLLENNLDIKYSTNCRVDMFNKEVCQILKEMGCIFINIGFESLSQEVLDKLKKNVTVEQNINAAKICNEVVIGFGLNFLWGLPGDTEESLFKAVEFIKKYNLYEQIRTIRPPTPYPGCDLYYHAIENGYLKGPEDFFNRFKNSDLILINFTDIHLSRMYELLFKANKELIIDHFKNTKGDMEESKKLIEKFRKLYFESDFSFSGSRHYDKISVKGN